MLILDRYTSAGPVKFAKIDVAASGDNTIVAAVAASAPEPAKKIRVLGYVLVADGAVTAQWQSGAAGTALSGAMSLAANGGVSAPFSPVGQFETVAGALLNLSLGGAVGVRGHLVYQEA